MFFSLGRKNTPAASSLQARLASVASAGKTLSTERVDEQDSQLNVPVVEDAREIKGKYLTFDSFSPAIPEVYKSSFVLMEIDAASVAIVQTTKQLWGRGGFALRDIARKNKYTNFQDILATEEVIKTLHRSHEADQATLREDDSDIQKYAWELIARGVAAGASDIHLENRGPQTSVFFRIFGERRRQASISTETAKRVMAVLYNVEADAGNAGTNWKEDQVQDTAAERVLADEVRVQVRFNSAPIYPHGNVQLTLRVLRMTGGQSDKNISEVGYTPEMCAEIEDMLTGSTGLVLLVGPTNSGKSTSTQAFVKYIYKSRGPTIKLLTIEDPVEYVIPDACQMGVPRGSKSAEEIAAIYKAYLGSCLRQDPDVCIVGEIRTNEQAEPVKDMVLAGRKILSTLHVYDVLAVYDRLSEIGVPASLLCRRGFLSGVIYQRLVPILCPSCSLSVRENQHKDEFFERGFLSRATYKRLMHVCDLSKDDVRVRGMGCDKCNMMGIIGRTPCAELLVPSEEFLEFIRRGDHAGARQHWLRTGLNVDGAGVTAVAHGISKMRKGMVSPVDVEIQIGKLEIIHPSENTNTHGQGSALDMLAAGRVSAMS